MHRDLSQAKSLPQKRLDSIDCMRALALIIMVPAHFLLFLAPYETATGDIYTFVNEFLGGLAGPLFIFLVGLSLSVSSATSAQPASDSRKKIIKRACILLFITVLFKFSIEATLNEWGALTLIAASLFVLAMIKEKSALFYVVLIALLFVLTPALRDLVGYLDYWSPTTPSDSFSDKTPAIFMDVLNEYLFSNDERLLTNLVGFFVTGYFPIFPFLIFPLLGHLMATRIYVAKATTKEWLGWALVGALWVGAGCVLVALAMEQGTANLESGYITSLHFFPLVPSWLLIQMGFCVLLTLFLHHLLDQKKFFFWGISYCRLISRYSLTTYITHYLLVYWPLRWLGTQAGHPLFYFGKLLSVPLTLGLSLLVLVGYYFVYQEWDRHGAKYSPDWFIKWASS